MDEAISDSAIGSSGELNQEITLQVIAPPIQGNGLTETKEKLQEILGQFQLLSREMNVFSAAVAGMNTNLARLAQLPQTRSYESILAQIKGGRTAEGKTLSNRDPKEIAKLLGLPDPTAIDAALAAYRVKMPRAFKGSQFASDPAAARFFESYFSDLRRTAKEMLRKVFGGASGTGQSEEPGRTKAAKGAEPAAEAESTRPSASAAGQGGGGMSVAAQMQQLRSRAEALKEQIRLQSEALKPGTVLRHWVTPYGSGKTGYEVQQAVTQEPGEPSRSMPTGVKTRSKREARAMAERMDAEIPGGPVTLQVEQLRAQALRERQTELAAVNS